MSNKLYYKLGLEELVEPEVTTPVVELQGSQLEVEQLHHELSSDTAQLEQLSNDTTTMEEVRSSLEAALSGIKPDPSAMVFIHKTITMMDKRWGFNAPLPSMEDQSDTLVASLEGAVTDRIKTMGKGLMEMLKKLWEKLKTWFNKLLSLLGLKKKKIEELKQKVEELQELEKNGGKADEKPEVKEEAKTTEEEKKDSSTPPPLPKDRPKPPELTRDTVNKNKHRVLQSTHGNVGGDFRIYEALIEKGGKFPGTDSSKPFTWQIGKLIDLLSVLSLYNKPAKEAVGKLRSGELDSIPEIFLKGQGNFTVIHGKDAYEGTKTNEDARTMPGVLPGLNCVFSEPSPSDKMNMPRVSVGKTIEGRAWQEENKTLEEKDVTWLGVGDMTRVLDELYRLLTLFQTAERTAMSEVEKITKELMEVFTQNESDEKKAPYIRTLVTRFSEVKSGTIGAYSSYVNRYIGVLLHYLNACQVYWYNKLGDSAVKW